jgi:polysaccharide export outer membrane protein
MRLSKWSCSVVTVVTILSLLSYPLTSLGQASDYVVGPYDILQVQVFELPEMSHNARVFSDGRISYPLLGDIMVAGLTIKEVEEEFRRRLSDFIVNPLVTVVIAPQTAKRVLVLGQVRRPGAYEYVEGKRVTEYIAMAGGPSGGANLGAARVIRPQDGRSQVWMVDLDKVFRGGRKDLDIVVEGYDTVILPKTWFQTLKDWAPILGITLSGMALTTAILRAAR